MTAKSRKFRIAAGTLTLPTDVTTDELFVDEEAANNTPREKLNHFLNLLSVQGVIVTLVVMDTLLVLFLLLIELQVVQAPPGEPPQYRAAPTPAPNVTSPPPSGEREVQRAEGVMHYVQVSVLCVFVLEIILRIAARGVDIVYDKWQVFDSLVVTVTFVLYVALMATVTRRDVTYSVGFIILLRLWRIGRIHYDLTQPVVQKARRLIHAHRRAWKHTEEELKHARANIAAEQEKVEALRHKLRSLSHAPSSTTSRQTTSPSGLSSRQTTSPSGLSSRQTTSTSGLSSHSPSSYSGDTMVASEDDHPAHPSAPRPAVPLSVSLLRSLRSRSLPSATPRGSLDTDSSVSLPGSPRSLHHGPGGHGGPAGGSMQHGSSGRIPDLVEHTQTADLVRDPSFKESLLLARLTGSGATTLTDTSNASTATTATSGGGKYRKNPAGDRPRLSHAHRSASASNLVDPGNGSHDDNTATLPRIRAKDHDGRLYPSDGKGDKRQLIDDTKRTGSSELAFHNPSFSGLTDEDLNEIARVSQVPFNQFGSISHLLQEGIPISEL